MEREYAKEVIDRVNDNLRHAIKDQAYQASTQGTRATGVTTRLIDAVIQFLFVHGQVSVIHDKLFNNEMEVKHFLKMLSKRLWDEHKCEIESLSSNSNVKSTLNLRLSKYGEA